MTPHPFHKSSFRPQFILAAERTPMLMLITLAIGLPAISFNLFSFAVGVFLWLVVHPLLVWMGKADPQLIAIYQRYLRYPGYIPAHTTPFRKRF
jgi:type IV secretory pathway TrbD component